MPKAHVLPQFLAHYLLQLECMVLGLAVQDQLPLLLNEHQVGLLVDHKHQENFLQTL